MCGCGRRDNILVYADVRFVDCRDARPGTVGLFARTFFSKNMKAAVRTKYGPPEVLNVRDVEQPVPKDDEIIVRVHACTVNRTDCGILLARPFVIRFFTGLSKPKLPTTGTDFAGVVEAAGAAVRGFGVGDRVWGFDDNGLGSHAQYLAIRADKAIQKIPEHVSFDDAAASAEGAHYAYTNVRAANVQPGQKVLVNGATGAIGSAAVQILKYFGAEVTAVCATENVDRVRALGADRVVDYTQEDFTKIGEKFAFVFDAVGKSSFGRCKPLLLPGGIYISTELGPRAENPFRALLAPFSGGKKVLFPLPLDIKGSLVFMQSLLEQGRFKPLIDRKYPLEKIREAFEYADSGRKIGNVLIDPWG